MNNLKTLLSISFFFFCVFLSVSAQEGASLRGYLQCLNDETQAMDTLKGAVHPEGEFYLYTLTNADSKAIVQDYLLKITEEQSIENTAFEFRDVQAGSYKISVTEFGKSANFKKAAIGEIDVQVEEGSEDLDLLLPITKNDEPVLGFYWYAHQFQLDDEPIEKYELKNFIINVYDSNDVFLARSFVYEDWDGGDFICMLGGVPFQNKLRFEIEKKKQEGGDAYAPYSFVYSPNEEEWNLYTQYNQGFAHHFTELVNLSPLPYLRGTISYDEGLSELPSIAKIEITNKTSQESQIFYTESYAPGMLEIQLQKGIYQIDVFAQGAKKSISHKEITEDEDNFDILLEDDSKSAFIAVAPKQENGELFYAPITYTYSIDNGFTWNEFPVTTNSSFQKTLHYYGEGNVQIKANAGENYLMDSIRITKTDYALKHPLGFVWENIVRGRADTIHVQGVTAYQYYNASYELITVPIPNVKVELLDEASEYGEPILTIESDQEGKFNIKFLGKLTTTYGLANLSESTKKYELLKDNGFPVLSIFSWNVSFPSPENPYSQEGLINMTKIEPPVVELSAKQTSMGEEAVKLEWKLSQKAVEIGAEVDSFQIFRFSNQDGAWDYGSLLLSSKNLKPDNEGMYSYIDMGNAGLGLLPPSLGSVYKYNVAVTYKNNMKEKVDYCMYYTSSDYDCLATTEKLEEISFEMDVRVSYLNENTGKDFEYNIVSVKKDNEIFTQKIFGGNQVSIPKLPEGKYSLTVNARGETWTVEDIEVNVSELNAEDKIPVQINLRDQQHASILKINVLDKAGNFIKDAKIQSLQHEFTARYSNDDIHLFVLPQTEHKILVSSDWFIGDTIDFTMDTTFKEINITLIPNKKEAVYAFGCFNTKNIAFLDILGKKLKVKHKASGLTFDSKEVMGLDGKFAFEQVLSGDFEFVFENSNLSLIRMGSISNDFQVFKSGDTVEIFKDEPPLELKRIAFNIAGEIKFGQINNYMTDVQIFIKSARDERRIKLSSNDSPKFNLEGFKGNANYYFEVQCEGYETIKLNQRLSFRNITQREDNTHILGENDLKLKPIKQMVKVKVSVFDEEDKKAIKEVKVKLLNEKKDSVAIGLTDENGQVNLSFEDFINNGLKYTIFFIHADYHIDSMSFIMPIDTISISASLLKIPSYKVMVVSTDEKKGSVSGSGIYKLGSRVNVQAIPATGYIFAKWGLGSDTTKVSEQANYSFVLHQQEDIELRAYFEKYTQVEEDLLNTLHVYAKNSSVYFDGIQSPVWVEITDVMGRRVFHQYLSTSQSVNLRQNGVYMVRLYNNKASVLKKLMVQ